MAVVLSDLQDRPELPALSLSPTSIVSLFRPLGNRESWVSPRPYEHGRMPNGLCPFEGRLHAGCGIYTPRLGTDLGRQQLRFFQQFLGRHLILLEGA